MDLDGDGRPDVVSGSYASRIYLWRGLPVRRLGPREELLVLSDAAFKDGHVACHAVDWDGDGDVDLLAGSRKGFVFLVPNAGSPKEPRFGEPAPLRAGDRPLKTPDGDAGPHGSDWDGDGNLDLLVGDDTGRVSLYRNAGDRKAPRLEPGEELLPPKGGRHVEERCRVSEECAMRAKPWVVDWNGDGLPDLLVGDFHDHRTPGQMGNERMHGWVWLYLRRKAPEAPLKR